MSSKLLEKRPRIVASVEVRMGSSRFPGKVLEDICGKPAVIRLLERLKSCVYLDDIIVATTTESQDDVLADCVVKMGYKIFRGSEEDVLERVVLAHEKMKSDIVVEITGDCPLLDPQIVDLGVATFLNNDCDVVSNTHKLSFPQGVDVQVFKLDTLTWVHNNIDDPAVREHVSLYFYESKEKFRIIHLQAPPCWHQPHYRFQLDYKEDLQFIRKVYESLMFDFPEGFGLTEIMNLLAERPALIQINKQCVEKEIRA